MNCLKGDGQPGMREMTLIQYNGDFADHIKPMNAKWSVKPDMDNDCV